MRKQLGLCLGLMVAWGVAGAGETTAPPPNVPPKVEVGAQGELRVGEKAFFPIFVWNQSQSMVPYQAELGMNAMSAGESAANEPRLPLLNTLQQHGMYLFAHTSEYTPEIAAHPALLAWMHGDEPDLNPSVQYEVDRSKLPTEGYVLFEGEAATATTFNANSWLNRESAALSGRKWLGVDCDGMPEPPYQATYDFEAPKEAEYNFFVREFDKSWACPTTWRIDGGAWNTTARNLQTADTRPAGRNTGVGWANYGKVKLAAGKHTLEIVVKESRTCGASGKTANVILGAYDLFLFTTADSYPPAKPNELTPRTDPATLKTAYQAMRTRDPNHPVWLNLTSGFFSARRQLDLKWYRAFGEAADCLSFDHYPVTGYNQPAGVPELAAATREFVQLYPGKANWVIVEASDQDLDWTPKQTRGPTPREMRAEVWMAVTAGAKGIGYFTIAFQPFRWNNLSKGIVEELQRTNGQLKELAPAILSYDAGPKVVASTDQVQFLVRRHAQAVYLFAVSLELLKAEVAPDPATAPATVADKGDDLLGGDAEPVVEDGREVEFSFPPEFAGATVEVIGESRKLVLTGGKLKDPFAGLAVHLYRIPAPGPAGVNQRTP